jgi:hypothetical protein
MTRQQALDEIRRLIEAHGFCAKDFFLTAPRARGRANERTRQRLARQLHSLGCSAHDLIDKFPAGATGAASRTSRSTPE